MQVRLISRSEHTNRVVLEIAGHRFVSNSNRRYLVVAVRPEPFTNENGTYVAFVRTIKRTDNITTARNESRKYWMNNRRPGDGLTSVAIDTADGEVIN